jgi:hypothetical protein
MNLPNRRQIASTVAGWVLAATTLTPNQALAQYNADDRFRTGFRHGAGDFHHYDDRRGGIGTGGGAAIGGVGGAALGAAFGGGIKGTLIGGAVGAGIGAAVGRAQEKKRDRDRLRHYYRYHRR